MNENVLVLGLGKSGHSTIAHLQNKGIPFIVNDGAREEGNPNVPFLQKQNIPAVFGSHPLTLLEGITTIVKTPGFPYSNELLQEAQKRQIPIITEVELGYLATNAKLVAITGSNGKTTTTALVGEIFQQAERKSTVCGNIGTPFLEVATDEQYEWLVAELSSFQLKGTEKFQPNIAAFLNFSETHMDFHGNRADYFESKLRIFHNQTKDDVGVLNADDPSLQEVATQFASTFYWFSATKEVDNGTFIRNGSIYFKEKEKEVKLIDLKDIPLKGNHNVENVLAASLIALLAGIEPSTIQNAIQQFQAMEHRLEPVSSINGVTYYNDSKATNPVSTIKACTSFTEPLVLILGGKDRGSDLSELLPVFEQGNIRAVIAFGETKHRFAELATIANVKDVLVTDTLDQAVLSSSQISKKGDIVLFSPACASWGMYTSYIERGHHFKSLVSSLKGE